MGTPPPEMQPHRPGYSTQETVYLIAPLLGLNPDDITDYVILATTKSRRMRIAAPEGVSPAQRCALMLQAVGTTLLALQKIADEHE